MAPGAVIVVSPHLDDAVFSVGQILAAHPGSTVITVFAGLPPFGVLTPYDESAGFQSSRTAVEQRQKEDAQAGTRLDFEPVHGPFLDGAYGFTTTDIVAEWLAQWDGPVLAPLGIHHPDHILVADACRQVFPDALVYEESPYRVQYPELAAQRRATLGDFKDADLPAGPAHVKAAAVQCYGSQMNPTTRSCVDHPERIWERAS